MTKNEKVPTKPTRKRLFLSLMPKGEGKQMTYPTYLDNFPKEYLVFHPSYDFDSNEGKETIAEVGEPPQFKHPWENSFKRDVWCIECAKF